MTQENEGLDYEGMESKGSADPRLVTFREALAQARTEAQGKTPDELEHEMNDALREYIRTVNAMEVASKHSTPSDVQALRNQIEEEKVLMEQRLQGSDEAPTTIARQHTQRIRRLEHQLALAAQGSVDLEQKRTEAHNRLAGLFVVAGAEDSRDEITLKSLLDTFDYLGEQDRSDRLRALAQEKPELLKSTAVDALSSLEEYPEFHDLSNDLDALTLANSRRLISKNNHNEESTIDIRTLQTKINLATTLAKKLRRYRAA